MKAIILAAGQGIRLGNDFSEQPKCLLNIGDKTILEKQVVTFSIARYSVPILPILCIYASYGYSKALRINY